MDGSGSAGGSRSAKVVSSEVPDPSSLVLCHLENQLDRSVPDP